MKPTFPMEPAVGQFLFFADPKLRNQITHFGKVIGQDGSKWRLKLLNCPGHMSFDPKTGVARPKVNVLNCVWIGGAELLGLTVGAVIKKVLQDMEADNASTVSETGVPQD